MKQIFRMPRAKTDRLRLNYSLKRCLVANHSLLKLTLGKYGKLQKVWLVNWLPHFVMPKEILPHFLNL